MEEHINKTDAKAKMGYKSREGGGEPGKGCEFISRGT